MSINRVAQKTLARLLDLKTERLYRKKINKIYRNLGTSSTHFNKQLISQHTDKWKALHKNPDDRWYRVYSYITHVEDVNYIPEDIYYTVVEPALNFKPLLKAYADKNYYDVLYDRTLFPHVLIRNIDGIYYDHNYTRLNMNEDELNNILKQKQRIVIKPAIDSGGGENVKIFNRDDGNYSSKDDEILSVSWMGRIYKRNFLIQQYIEQHEFFKQFNTDSLNTIRILTYRSVKNEQIIPLHAVLRIGKKGNCVDNQAAGGISCGLSPDGTLNNFAIDKHGKIYKEYNGIEFNSGRIIPRFKEMSKYAISIAGKNPYARILGFDFCLDKNERIYLIEINNANIEINFLQMNNGPLFLDYTDEIIDYCKNNSRSYCLDFTI